jgi:hypothetical protein
MTRTTIDIDIAILEEIRAIQQEVRRPMGRIVSELLAEALTQRSDRPGIQGWSGSLDVSEPWWISPTENRCTPRLRTPLREMVG